jgi:hypothetical protein
VDNKTNFREEIMKKYILFISVLFLLSCARPLSWKIETKQTGPFSYGPPTNVNFQLSTTTAGESAIHTLTFDIKAGDLETYKTIITYPKEYTFNGFLALGPAGTQIGSYSVDFDFDGSLDFTIPVYSIDNTNAYADRDLNGVFTASIDSTIVYSNSNGKHVFTTTLPFGGDADPQTVTGPFTERVTAVLNAGILTNPASGGNYTATGVFTSVDPDTDGDDDGQGQSPQVLNFTQDIVITPTSTNNPPSAPQLVYPRNGETGLGTTVTFQWNRSTDPDGDNLVYHLYYCEAEDFSGCNPVDIASLQRKSIYNISILSAYFIFCGFVAGFMRRKRTGILVVGILIIASIFIVSCGNGGTPTGDISYKITDLEQSTTYFWKVVADDSKEGTTESETWSFTTF